MILCLLVQITRNRQGQPVRRESSIHGNAIQIGRGTNCKIRLLDHRVALHHATLALTQDGAIELRPEGDADVAINGVTVRDHAPLLPGDRVSIGPCLLVVDPSSVAPQILLTVEMKPEADEEKSSPPLTLAELKLSKRKIGFALAASILLLFMVLPMLPGFSADLDKWQSALPVTLNDAWSPGPLTGGHRVMGARCSVCHQQPFRAVPDEACTACHKQVGRHLADNELHRQLFKEVRCTECHVDHQGAKPTRDDSSRCVACHADIKAKNPKATVANVHDFSTDHPPFRITLQDGKDGRPLLRALQNQMPQEKPNLKYSHKVHLVAEGVSSPEGDTVMTCKDCHQVDPGGEHFVPMTMEKTCQQSGCHKLYFAEPVDIAVPHRSVPEAMNRLRKYYTQWLAETPANAAECKSMNSAANAAQQALDCAAELAQENAAESLFKEKIGCRECHEIEATDDKNEPWKVTPLKINQNWHANSVFPHIKHITTACTACHDKQGSNSSADISMPELAKCRECHVHDKPVRGKVSSTCDSCHRFHGEADVAK